MNRDDLLAAAHARGAAVADVHDRPSERRCAEMVGAPAIARVRSAMELREASTGGGWDFHGVASATGIGYEMYDAYGPYTELVTPGAFGASLAQPDLDVPLVLAHDSLRRIARTTNGTLTLTEVLEGDDTGLHVHAPNLDPGDVDVAYIAPKLRNGLVDEMSFRFRITAGQWSPDWTEYHINGVDIDRGDVAIVGYGANPYTTGALRADDGRHSLRRDAVALEARSHEWVRTEFTRLRAELRRRGITEPRSLEWLRDMST